MEVVSADSRQVYRGMDVATGKPTAEERTAVPHHLLDLIEPDERYHAARFRLEARSRHRRDSRGAAGCRSSWEAPGSTSGRSCAGSIRRRPPTRRCGRVWRRSAAASGSAALHER